MIKMIVNCPNCHSAYSVVPPSWTCACGWKPNTPEDFHNYVVEEGSKDAFKRGENDKPCYSMPPKVKKLFGIDK